MNPEQYRKSAAETLNAVPKDERPLQLAEMQKSEEYWIARANKLKESGQKVEFSEDRTSLHWDIKSLYHGTDIPEIGEFSYAEESTIGNNAIYFTIDPSLAMGYAKLRGKERGTKSSFLYEMVLKDINLMNWAEKTTVDILKRNLVIYCQKALNDLHTEGYARFSEKYGVWPSVQEWTALSALERIIQKCEQENYLRSGNIKEVAQGVMGTFFEKFVRDSGYDGVITIEGGDDFEFTAKPGVSVVLFNKDKIISHRHIDVAPQP